MNNSTLRLNPSENILASIALACITLFVFFPALEHGFNNFDTQFYIPLNKNVNTGLSLENIAWAFTTNHMANWHPITWISHMLDVEMFGLNPKYHHLNNILLHTLNAVLVFLFFNYLTKTALPSFLVATLFAIHPTQIESVAWVAERKDILFTLFLLLGLAFYYAWQKTKNLGYYALSFLSFIIGAMAKPMIVTFPFIILLMDVWPLQRLVPTPQFLRVLLLLCKEKIPFFIVSAIVCVITFNAQTVARNTDISLTFGDKVAHTVVAYAFYIEKTFFPFDLSFYYPHPGTWPLDKVGVSIAVLLASVTFMLISLFRDKLVFFGIALFLGMLVPVIGIVQVGGQAYADRYSYVPNIGLFTAVVFPTYVFLIKHSTLRFFPFLAVASILIILGYTSTQQLKIWGSERELWGNALLTVDTDYQDFINNKNDLTQDRRPASLALPYFMVGYAFKQDHLYTQAIRHFDVAIAAGAQLPFAYYHKAFTQLHMGQYQLAHENILRYQTASKLGNLEVSTKKILFFLEPEHLSFIRENYSIFQCKETPF